MRDRLDEFGDSTRVVLLTFTSSENLTRYAAANQLPFPILVDPDRDSYRAYGLGRGSVRRIWGRKAAVRYMQILRKDGLSGLARPTEDSLQLGGDFVIAPDGTLAYGFWGKGPDDRPSVDDLVFAVQKI